MQNEDFWDFTGMQEEQKYPVEYLMKIKDDFNEKFMPELYANIIESVSSDSERISYSLYIVVPKLKDLFYKLLHVDQLDVSGYPSKIILFALALKNNQYSEELKTPDEFEKELNKLFYSPLTKAAVYHLKKLIEIKEHYSKDIQ